MRTGGYGNDGLITLVPIGVLVAVGVMLFGGPIGGAAGDQRVRGRDRPPHDERGQRALFSSLVAGTLEADVHDVAYPLATVDGEARPSVDLVFERRLTILFGAAILSPRGAVPRATDVREDGAAAARRPRRRVWNTCVVSSGHLPSSDICAPHDALAAAAPAWFHLGVLALPLFALPIAVTGAPPPATGTPVWWLLGVLGLSVGLPFFVVSTTSPAAAAVVLRDAAPRGEGSVFSACAPAFAGLIALVSYPAIIELSLRLADQSRLWTWACGLFVALVAACAMSLRSWGRRGRWSVPNPGPRPGPRPRASRVVHDRRGAGAGLG